MSLPPPLPRVVLDTVVFVQALISGRGASAGCIERLRRGQFILLLSEPLLAEMREVPLRPELRRRYSHLTGERVAAFLSEVQLMGVMVYAPPRAFVLPRDPDDEPLIDLAVAGEADYLVTWNERHLTYLMRGDTPEGRDFRARFPAVRIVSPPEFIARLEQRV
jgi:uncharacterized protein